MSRSLSQRAGACLLLLLVSGADAQSPPARPESSITLDEALVRTLRDSPELRVAGYQVHVARGHLEQAALPPNPVLNATLEDALGTRDHRGLSAAETTVTLAWVLERGLRERVVDFARAELAVSTFDAELARLDAAAETARRYVAALALQARNEHARQAVALAGDVIDVVRRRVDAGAAPRAELERALADLVRAELVLEDIEHEHLTARHRLAGQWGAAQPDFAAVAGDIAVLPESIDFATLIASAERNPDLLRYASRRRVDEAQLALAEAGRRPGWIVSAGVRRFEATDEFALVAGIEIPLAIRDRNEGRISAARAGARVTDAAAAAERIRIQTDLFALHQEFEHSLHVAERVGGELIPRLDSALEETRQAYQIGRHGYHELRAVQLELLEARGLLLAASEAAHRIAIEIERLTGVAAGFSPQFNAE